MFSEIEIKRIEKAMLDLFVSRRPAPEHRNKLDINYKKLKIIRSKYIQLDHYGMIQ